MKRTKKSENGQAVVEFALILPVLVIILCGTMDAGWLFLNSFKVQYAASEGARYAGIYAPRLSAEQLDADIEELVSDNLGSDVEDTEISTSIGGRTATVTVRGRIRPLTFVLETAFGSDGIRIGKTAVSALDAVTDSQEE